MRMWYLHPAWLLSSLPLANLPQRYVFTTMKACEYSGNLDKHRRWIYAPSSATFENCRSIYTAEEDRRSAGFAPSCLPSYMSSFVKLGMWDALSKRCGYTKRTWHIQNVPITALTFTFLSLYICIRVLLSRVDCAKNLIPLHIAYCVHTSNRQVGGRMVFNQVGKHEELTIKKNT